MTESSPPAPRIDDYGVIGNLHTAALVSKYGSLDFLSYPRFDSATVFARLLDRERGGTWSIGLAHDDAHTTQHYSPDSAVLVTRHMSPEGTVEVTDFMPPVDEEEHCQIVRRVQCVIGRADVRMRFDARYPYAASRCALSAADTDSALRAWDVDLGPRAVRVFSSVALVDPADATFAMRDGDVAYFLLQSEDCSPPEPDLASFGESLHAYTQEYWRDWTSKITYEGPHRGLIYRSAITLKLCISAKYGSSVAAVTFGLPELPGESLNWDYRYTWIRDSAFSMYAMLRLGLSDEATAFINWIQARCEELDDASKLSLMYRVDGRTDLEERELEEFAGYQGSKPVRIGNGAAGQWQLDIYGELIDTVYLYDRFGHEITYAFWQNLREIIDHVCEHWQNDDHGIWEARQSTYPYTVSKVMAWVAIDRGIRIAQHRGFPAPMEKWFAARDAVYDHIYTEHYDEGLDAWTQRSDNAKMDGSLLMLPLVRFVTTAEPKWQSTMKQIEQQLVRGHLVARYLPGEDHPDYPANLIGGEGYFTMCSMWYVEVLAKSDRGEEARQHLQRLAAHANHLGLFSEEIGARGEQIGNFPQAFTHLGFISAALQVAQLDKSCPDTGGGPKG